MNKNEFAALISLIFLGIYSYGLYAVRNFAVTLPFLGEISVSASGEFLVFAGLVLTFIIFWKARRESQTSEPVSVRAVSPFRSW